MDKKKKLVLTALGFVVLMVAAYFLYDRLAKNQDVEQLATFATEESTEAAPPAEESSEVPSESSQEATEAPQLTPASDFTVYDADGNAVKLSDYFGKPIVLNFWASWCGPCKSEMPEFNEKYAELDGEVQFLMVNMTDGSRETLEIATAFVESTGYTFPVFYDLDVDAAMTYSVYSLPTTYFIDAQGYLMAQATGAIDAETLQAGIDYIYNPA